MSLPGLGALITTLFLAQAEPAPEPPAEAEPAPAEPAPAEPAAATPAPTPAEPPPDYTLSIALAGARRLGDAAREVGPRNGFEVAMGLGYVYARPAGLELAAGGGFSYQRYRSIVQVSYLPGTAPIDTERTFSFYEFQLHQTASLPLGHGVGQLRPYLDVGAGFALAYFSSREPTLSPGELRTTRPIASGTVGLDVVTGAGGSRAGLAFGFVHMFSAPTLHAPADRTVEVFGDRAMLRLTFLQPF
jgi:hypothetical protein